MDLFDVYPLYELTPERGLGCQLFDAQGNEYLDFYGGHAVVSIGHSHPHYIHRISSQLSKLGFYSNSVINPVQIELAEKLGVLSGYQDYQLFLVNSGAEANENALKLASFYQGRSKVIAFQSGFHGRTAGALAVTDFAKLRAPINENDNVFTLPLNDIPAVEGILKDHEIAAVIIEGVQGIAGVHIPEVAFLKKLRELCNTYNTVLILDEIQSGFGRTGKFFAHQYADIQPDIITMAKGMGNGFPLGGVLIHPKFQAVHGQLGTTFGGNHLACCAGLAVLEVIESENLMKNAEAVGSYLVQRLEEIALIKAVRGLGLMIGLDLGYPVKALRQQLLFQEHVFVGSSSDPRVLRLLPPLCASEKDADQFVDSLKNLIKT